MRFGTTTVLADVDIVVKRGEVHGLLGENGSGKSTLIKILSGYHTPEPGTVVRIDGVAASLPLRRFRDFGLAFVHQDLGLIPSLSVLENFAIGRLSESSSLRLDWRAERRRAQEAFARLDLDLDLDETVSELSAVDRALLAIVRASTELSEASTGRADRPALLVLDEPTVYLPPGGTDRLFALVRRLVAEGNSALFVSHDLDEVLQVTDEVTVLRDGRVAGHARTGESSREALVEMILGRPFERRSFERASPVTDEPRVEVRNLQGETVHDLSFDIRPGEALGLAGLIGSGIEAVPYLIMGATTDAGGTLRVDGRTHALDRMTPAKAVGQGVALVPADRAGDGSLMSLSVEDNMMMAVISRFTRGGRIRGGAMRQVARDLLNRFDIRPRRLDLEMSSLSGGNQQKVLMAKWIQAQPRLLVLHQPTQGVDVGAREEIFEAVNAWVREGGSVLCASSDHEDLERLCTRVIVLAHGRAVVELDAEAVTRERIAEACYQSN